MKLRGRKSKGQNFWLIEYQNEDGCFLPLARSPLFTHKDDCIKWLEECCFENRETKKELLTGEYDGSLVFGKPL